MGRDVKTGIFEKNCKMREINMQKTLQNASNLYAKKHCEMHQIYMQKTLQNASNSHAKKTLRNASNSHAKNTAKCVTFLQIFHVFCI